MSNTSYGETSWDDSSSGSDSESNSKDLFLRLDNGPNKLRLITNPFKYLVHRIKKDANDPKDYGQKVNCSAPKGFCPACDLGDKAKLRWFIGVISRKDQTAKILDISKLIHDQIKTLHAEDWGDPQKYDINIIQNPKGGPSGFYKVNPATSKEPLSAADQKLKDEFNFAELKRRTDPPTAEQVEKRLEKILGDKYVKTKRTPAMHAATAQSKIQEVEMSSSEDSPDFPNYEEQ